MATKFRVEKKRLNTSIKKSKKDIQHFKNIGANTYYIDLLSNTLKRLEFKKTELLTKYL